jgi:diguanylate cyclase (GGDEF)-like protein/PAS domain S-box-containing protein
MPRWSREEICEFVKDKRIYARDAQAGTVEAPEWLVAASQGVGPNDDSAEAMESTHPEDRNTLIATFIEALGSPGTTVQGQLRANNGGDWTTVQIEWVNLIDDPDIGCLICTIAEVGSGAYRAPVIAETGAYENTRWMVLDVHTSGVIRSVDGKVRETTGYQANELVGRLISEFLHHDALADGVANWVELAKSIGATSTSRRPWRVKGGGHIWLEGSYLNRGEDSILAVVWDITEKRKQEQELADLTAQFQILADEVPAAVFRCDLDGRVLFHNARWSKLIEDRDGETRLHDLIATDDVALLSATLAELASDEQGERRAIDVGSRDGVSVWRLALRPAGDLGAGRVTVVGSIEDVTATVRLESEVRHDALTGVLNRHGLDGCLRELLGEAPESTLVAFIDLDGFKTVNDRHGHEAGDVVLTEVGRRLSRGLRPGDAVGRYGGDEFVVICRDVPPGDDGGIVARIDRCLAGPVAFEGGGWVVAGSIGTARVLPGEDLAGVLRRADRAMFEVKRERKRAFGLDVAR